MDLATILLSILFISIAVAMLATRILFVKNGEFRGTCSTNNPLLKNEIGECKVCGARPNEACKKVDE